MKARTAPEVQRCSTCASPSDDLVCARCRDARDLLPDGISVGDWVRLPGEQAVYRLHGFHRDGSARVYGGTRGRQQWRALPIERLLQTTRPDWLPKA